MKIVPGTMVLKGGCGPTPIVTLKSTLYVNIVSNDLKKII